MDAHAAIATIERKMEALRRRREANLDLQRSLDEYLDACEQAPLDLPLIAP